jgi:alkylhydroperoxidase family enzyme
LVEQVLADFRTAPIGERLRATLEFLRKVTLEPDTVGPDDADAARAAGVSDGALCDALYVCAYFNLIDRLADSFGFTPVSHLLSPEEMREYERAFFARGYA